MRSVDKEDGDLTDQIDIVDNTVDTTKAGLYSVTYKVTDKGGASAEKTINVVVKEKTFPPTTVSQNGSVNSAKTGDANADRYAGSADAGCSSRDRILWQKAV